MLRGWLAVLAVLVGIGLSFAADSPSPLARDKRYQEARQFLVEGKAAEARSVLEGLIRQYPDEPDLYLFLGIALLRLRDPQAAELNIKQALALRPDHVEARTLLGWIQLEIHGDFDAAIEEYSEVVRIRPDLAEAYNNLGVAQKRKGELNKAAASFNRALALNPDHSEALSNRGWVFAEENKWTDARRDFEGALKINPADDGALYGLSQALREERDYAGAQKALGRLISRSPNFVYWLEWGRIGLIRFYWVLLLIAIAFFMKGRFMKARQEVHGR
jgi:tetratricopeptide (TPR) repeat protein